MLQFLFQKIRSKKWMMLCMLTGNVLFVSILCCISMYSDSIQLRLIERSMNSYLEENNTYPLMIKMTSVLTVVSPERHSGAAFAQMENMAVEAESKSGVEVQNLVMNYSLTAKAKTQLKRDGRAMSLQLQLGFLSNLSEHSTVVSGAEYTASADENGIYSVMVSEKMLASQKLILGEVLTISNLTDKNGEELQVRIDGVFTNKEAGDNYWIESPGSYDDMMFLPEEVFRDLFVDFETPEYAMRGSWYVQFDYSELTRKDCEALNALATEYIAIVEQQTSMVFDENYTQRLEEFMLDDNTTSETLWILQAPILVLLVAFIMMVSKQMLVTEQTEMAILKSRGASKRQIICIYLLQSILTGVAASMIGIPLGAGICQILGSANAFMEFVSREALSIKMITADVLLNCFLAIVVTTAATIIPVITYADTSIVGHRQKKGKTHKNPAWQRFGLDFIVLAVAGYGLYIFSGKEDELMARVLAGESLDPLLYFSSSLFLVGAGLVIIRGIQLIVWLTFTIGKKLWSPALYASFIRVSRTRNEQNFIIVFLILTIALGIFNANTARTINANDEYNILYNVGANVVLQEQWDNNEELVTQNSTSSISFGYQEPDFNKYLSIDGVESAAKVYKGTASFSYSGNTYEGVEVMGIDTKEFGETAWFTDGLLESHWYNYLNAMAGNTYGILVSQSFQDEIGYQLGDTLYYTINGYQTRGIICGFVDYWPGFSPTVTVQWRDQSYEVSNFLIVSHRTQLQSILGTEPYYVYLKTTDSTEGIYTYIKDNDIKVTSLTDATETMIEHKNDAILQGTNGMLTVGFITILLLCVIGFLIYWILSIKSRTLQFGIFRAMGMTMREIVTMLINEQVFITGISVVAGVFVGVIASKLYVSLIQIAYTRADNHLPLMVISETGDILRILAVVSVMIVACIVILGTLISKTKIAQAIKLGED